MRHKEGPSEGGRGLPIRVANVKLAIAARRGNGNRSELFLRQYVSLTDKLYPSPTDINWRVYQSCTKRNEMMRRLITPGLVAAGLVFALSSCTNPYDPGQRAVGGGLLGAGAGAALGGAVGGGHGAALGAAIGGATGAVTGAATTPPPPPPPGYYGPGYPPPY